MGDRPHGEGGVVMPLFTNGGLILLLLLAGLIVVVMLLIADEHQVPERLWRDMVYRDSDVSDSDDDPPEKKKGAA